jgi:hypothetical protein
MKVIWETEDIKPGRRYSKKGIGENWIIGYLSDTDGEDRYVSVSELDGMVSVPYTTERMAQMLTENGFMPVELL